MPLVADSSHHLSYIMQLLLYRYRAAIRLAFSLSHFRPQHRVSVDGEDILIVCFRSTFGIDEWLRCGVLLARCFVGKLMLPHFPLTLLNPLGLG